jgi:hypothetical protein
LPVTAPVVSDANVEVENVTAVAAVATPALRKRVATAEANNTFNLIV